MRSNAILALVDKLFFPPACLACNAAIASAEDVLCADCRAHLLPITAHYCDKCGAPLEGYTCDICARTSFAFDYARAAYVYQTPAQELVHRLKYASFLSPAGFFSNALKNIPATPRIKGRFDFVTSVPLHRVRKRERGFNQSELIARGIARALGIPYQEPVYRKVNTPSQTNLSGEARVRNLSGAFALRGKADVAGKRVIVVDDVFTTGSTLNEVARVLNDNGAKRVVALTATRAV
jgi:ComF family protein